jgi:hypothetical protein
MAELNELLEAEKRDREELEELRRQEREDDRKAQEEFMAAERARLAREIEVCSPTVRNAPHLVGNIWVSRFLTH